MLTLGSFTRPGIPIVRKFNVGIFGWNIWEILFVGVDGAIGRGSWSCLNNVFTLDLEEDMVCGERSHWFAYGSMGGHGYCWCMRRWMV